MQSENSCNSERLQQTCYMSTSAACLFCAGWHQLAAEELCWCTVSPSCSHNVAVCCALMSSLPLDLCLCRFLRVIIVSSFREEAAAQTSVVGIHNDLAVLIKEVSQSLAGAPSNALLLGLFKTAAPFKMKTNVWARLRGQKEQLTIQVRSAAKEP